MKMMKIGILTDSAFLLLDTYRMLSWTARDF